MASGNGRGAAQAASWQIGSTGTGKIVFVLQTLAMDTTEHQRKYKHNDNGHDTHNAGHTGLALIGILCLHVRELGYHPEVGVIGMGYGHGTGSDSHNDKYLDVYKRQGCMPRTENQRLLIQKM